jgi:hypothetical protein
MASVLHFTSKRLAQAAAWTGILFLAGCASQGTLLEGLADLRLKTRDDAVVTKAVAVADQKPQAVKIVPVNGERKSSAWCEYLREDAAAQTTIMRSPTLRGSLDDEEVANLSLNLSATDFLKANLTEQAAEARCQRYVAESGLQKLIFVSPQGLTAAGHKARLKSINANKSEIARLRAKATRAMENGELDREKATVIYLLADQILTEAGASRSQADRRLETAISPHGKASDLGAQLLQAEEELENINSRMRTLDAVDLSVSAGWSDDIGRSGFDMKEESFSGKVNFSVRLGAVRAKRFEHERKATDAKLRAIRDEEGGVMWQVAILRRAHERAIAGLIEQQDKLEQALAKAQELATMLANVDNPEFEPPLIHAKLQMIKLKADRAAVAGSIAEIRENMAKLAAG